MSTFPNTLTSEKATNHEIGNYYSFKIFSRFWLVKTTRIIYHNQLLFTKFGENLRHIESMTSKVERTENNPLWKRVIVCNNFFLFHSLSKAILKTAELTSLLWCRSFYFSAILSSFRHVRIHVYIYNIIQSSK